jgi:hypothetical protein
MPPRPYGPNRDPRFALHQRQPRGDKLDARQQAICQADPAYADALRRRVSNERRFSAFMAGASYYMDLQARCAKCGDFKRRTRDRSCYPCHLARSGPNFERMKAGLAPVVQRSRASYLDRAARLAAERRDEFSARQFGDLQARSWPTGRLEVSFPNGHVEPDFSKLSWNECMNAIEMFPHLRDVFRWAGWSVD